MSRSTAEARVETPTDQTEREAALQKLEESKKPGAAGLLRVLRRADSEKQDAVMWSQNWNAHSRSS